MTATHTAEAAAHHRFNSETPDYGLAAELSDWEEEEAEEAERRRVNAAMAEWWGA